MILQTLRPTLAVLATIALAAVPLARAESLQPASDASVRPQATAGAQAGSRMGSWVGSWATSQQIPEPANALPTGDLHNATLREIVHLSVGGPRLRIRLSNAFGTAPLHLTSVHIARSAANATARIDPSTDRALTFAGAPEVTIPAGAEYLSDPVALPLPPFADLAITLVYTDAPAQQTGHPGARATSFLAHGATASSPDLPGAKTVDHWYQIAGVDVPATPTSRSIVALGDSITDGHGATTNGNDRWTDDLARRLQAQPSTRPVSVLNQGIGGNHLLTDGLGPNALARFDRDVLAQPGVRYLIVLEGINDLGALARQPRSTSAEHQALVHNLLSAYAQIIERAHAAGITVLGATVTPDVGSDYYHPDAASEADREALNAWIRTPGHFDAVVDFDRAVRDPAQPSRLLPAYDSGDHLHPSPAGYKAMADAIPLSLFRR